MTIVSFSTSFNWYFSQYDKINTIETSKVISSVKKEKKKKVRAFLKAVRKFTGEIARGGKYPI